MMKAKWMLTTCDSGINLTYYNIEDSITFDCGTTKMSSNLQDFLDFAMTEGAGHGDGMYFNGQLVCIIRPNVKGTH